MPSRHRLALGLLAASLLLLGAPWAQSQQPPAPAREITQIAGQVYRFRNANHYSVFAVTPAGVIATDPINADAARWLKAEIARRFNQPVRYLVYSHDHADHISGGEVFADTAIVVAHDQRQGRHRGREAPHRGAPAHLLRPGSRSSWAAPRRARLCGQEPLRQLDRDALPPRTRALRGRLHPRRIRTPSATSPTPTCPTGSSR